MTEPDELDDDPGTRGRQPIDITSLAAGIAVLALCVMFAFGDLDSVEDQLRIVWPLVLGTIGVALLAGVTRRG